jgi:peroxiredoxin
MEENNQWIDDRLATLNPAADFAPDVNRGLAQLRHRRHTRTRTWTWTWSAAAGVAGISLLAFPAPRAAAQYCLDCSTALWQNLSSPTVAHAKLDPQNARIPAPGFILNDASGAPVQLSQFKGKVVLLNFWATWCRACQFETPWFVGFQETYASRGFQVLGVSFDDDGWAAVKPFIAQKRVNYPVMMSDSQLAARYGGVQALPVTFIIDKAGRVAVTHLGLVPESEYQAEIEKLLSE